MRTLPRGCHGRRSARFVVIAVPKRLLPRYRAWRGLSVEELALLADLYAEAQRVVTGESAEIAPTWHAVIARYPALPAYFRYVDWLNNAT